MRAANSDIGSSKELSKSRASLRPLSLLDRGCLRLVSLNLFTKVSLVESKKIINGDRSDFFNLSQKKGTTLDLWICSEHLCSQQLYLFFHRRSISV